MLRNVSYYFIVIKIAILGQIDKITWHIEIKVIFIYYLDWELVEKNLLGLKANRDLSSSLFIGIELVKLFPIVYSVRQILLVSHTYLLDSLLHPDSVATKFYYLPAPLPEAVLSAIATWSMHRAV